MLSPFLLFYTKLSNRCCTDSTHHAGVEGYHIGNTVNTFLFCLYCLFFPTLIHQHCSS
ncbi:hypothetical protein PHAVU_011G034150 [Phaseolus vulgaris]